MATSIRKAANRLRAKPEDGVERKAKCAMGYLADVYLQYRDPELTGAVIAAQVASTPHIEEASL
ncbi:hypothetical protein [Luteibacter yeojuensis]|uniref:Uncharacterized protein n=1 Tax=Luteibacter yeojuensis TaxID=345309 RepID=A0A7X5QRL5_9GAMM|nr:hypothetical protein [Luteibacter yeojuensis]NID14111.1 hypothetical protein [Luteibacter yeojuensis]